MNKHLFLILFLTGLLLFLSGIGLILEAKLAAGLTAMLSSLLLFWGLVKVDTHLTEATRTNKKLSA